MEKSKINSSTMITVIVILLVLILSAYILIKDNTPQIQITEELAKCIGQNSELYVQTGCPACQKQEELFGNYVGYLTEFDCLEKANIQKCSVLGIEGTPTWVINGKKYQGLKQISELKSLAGC